MLLYFTTLYTYVNVLKALSKADAHSNIKQEEEHILKKTKGKLILALTAVLAAGAVTTAAGKAAATQCSDSHSQNINAETLLYCETDSDYLSSKQS